MADLSNIFYCLLKSCSEIVQPNNQFVLAILRRSNKKKCVAFEPRIFLCTLGELVATTAVATLAALVLATAATAITAAATATHNL